MDNLKRVIKTDLAAIGKSNKTFRDIFNIIFSHGSHIAYEILDNYEIKQVTYDELRIRIDEVAGFIGQSYPQIADEYIGIDLQNGPEFLTAFWAILKSGNKPYLVNAFYPAQLKAKLLQRLNVRLVVACTDEYSGIEVINPGDSAAVSPCPRQTNSWADEFAISSSLTGLEAKICIYDGESIANQIMNTAGIVKKNGWILGSYNGKIKMLAILPFFHIYGLVASYFWFSFFGRTMVFLQNNSPDTIKGAINRHQVTHVFAPPILYHKLYKGIVNNISQESDKRRRAFYGALKFTRVIQNIMPYWGVELSKLVFKEIINATFGKSIRFMINGGAFIEKDALSLINNIGYPLFNGYGTTETAITSADFRKKIKHRTSGAIGVPFTSVSYSLSDKQTLIISGGSICKKIISFDAEYSDFNSVQTDDIVEFSKGQYYIEGRETDLYIGDNGENISPDMIQNGLRVKNANNFSLLELDGKLALVLEYNSIFPTIIIEKEVEKLKQDLQSINCGLMVRDIYITYDKIASENAVKISRTLLRRMIAEGQVRLKRYSDIRANGDSADGANAAAVIDPGVGIIKGMFQKALDTDADIDVNANFFFDLGGTSLDYFAFISDLSATFNVQINLEKKNNLYTVADIYKYLTEVL